MNPVDNFRATLPRTPFLCPTARNRSGAVPKRFHVSKGPEMDRCLAKGRTPIRVGPPMSRRGHYITTCRGPSPRCRVEPEGVRECFSLRATFDTLITDHGKPARFRKTHSKVRTAKKTPRLQGRSQSVVSSVRVLTIARPRSSGGIWPASSGVKTRPPVAAARRSSGSREADSSTSSDVVLGTISSVASGAEPMPSAFTLAASSGTSRRMM